MQGQKRQRRGAAAQQYAIIVGLIGVVALLATASLGTGVRSLFSNTSNVLGNVINGSAPVVSGGGGGGGGGGAATPYPFTTHNFTPCGATGANGPSLSACQAAYTSPEASGWKTDPARYTVVGGIQRWTVPASATYHITVQGAQGACSGGGTPATMIGDFNLTEGDIIHILVGQRGLCWTGNNDRGGGGGGSFVVRSGTAVLIVAGGGGSGNATAGSATTALNAANPADSQSCGAGRGGLDGGGGGGGANYGAGGGGGFNTNGGNGSYGGYGYSGGPAGSSTTNGGNGSGPTVCVGQGGTSFLNGGTGGNTGCNVAITGAEGGFGGGGGGPSGNISGGGGGGWAGGAGGHYRDSPCSPAAHVNQSTGGASINTGSSQSNSVSGSGDGFVTITKL